ncbi:MAG: sulfotransferase [Rubrobacter sp.]|jgi:hypothetical protein|nr:sulfotransferase [Rubrobacter sp.]
MAMPNFLILGAMKAGTTALYYYLEQHPQVYMSPVKEPNFFAFEGEEMPSRLPGDPKGVSRASISDLETYRSLFSKATDERALGEASHSYLYVPKAVERIRYHVPDAKMIAILRNPVERAYSHFLHSVRTGAERVTDFAEALREEESGARSGPDFKDYVGRGFYRAQLERYYGAFDGSQIQAYLYEDLNTSPLEMLRDIFQFLKVDKTFVPDISLRRNVSGVPRNKVLDRFLRGQHPAKNALKLYLPGGLRWRLSRGADILKTRNLAKPPQLRADVRQHLVEVYREDVSMLQNLIGRDLSGWLD